MAADPRDLVLFKSTDGLGSGGPVVTDQGGAIVITQVAQQVINGLTFITGVSAVEGRGLTRDETDVGAGVKVLRYTAATTSLAYRGMRGANIGSSTFGSEVNVSAGGRFEIPENNPQSFDEGRRLIVDVVAGSLPGVDTLDTTITIIPSSLIVFRNPTSVDETFNGYEIYKCYYLGNINGVDTINNIQLWFSDQPFNTLYPSIGDQVAMGLDPAGIGDGSVTGVAIGPLANDSDTTTQLSGVTFSQPTTSAKLALGNLAPNERQAIWFRATVPANTPIEEIGNFDDVQGCISVCMELP